MTDITWSEIEVITGGRLGKFRAPCPICGPERRRAHNRKRQVLCVWSDAPDFATYNCVRCGASGYAKPEAPRVAKTRSQLRAPSGMVVDDEQQRAAQQSKARRLWQASRPALGTPVETYLRSRRIETRSNTVRFLPRGRPEHHPAMIVPYGLPTESEPGCLVPHVEAVHLTLLRSDGCGKAAADPNKITIASPRGMPLVLAPMNDLLGLAITEGIEDALSVHQATGLGAWAAGSAPFLPKLAPAVIAAAPDCVTICVDDDDTGRRNAGVLAALLTDHVQVLLRDAV